LIGRRASEKEERMWKMINNLEIQKQQKLMNCKEGNGPCENRSLFRHHNSHLSKLKRKDQKESNLDL